MALDLPIRARLTLAFAGLLAIILLAAGLLVHWGLARQLDAAINEDIEALAREFTADVNLGESDILADFGTSEPEGTFALILGADGGLLEASPSAERLTFADPALTSIQPMLPTDGLAASAKADAPLRVRLVAASSSSGKRIVVGQFLDRRGATLWDFALLLLAAGPALLIAVSILAWLLTGAALRPVERMRKEAALISQRSLDQRLRVPPAGDEIASLATTLNAMLDRLEAAFERQRRFVDDASHELRTPLGILTTELDLALRRARSHEELREALSGASDVTRRLNRLAEDMLVLARSDRGKLPLHKSRVRVAGVIAETAQFYRGHAEAARIGIETAADADLTFEADEMRLRQALGNVVANALVHTPPGGSVRIAAFAEADMGLAISVSDTGHGFPDGFLSKAFDPFARAGAGRSRRDGGAGLGLAIVKGVAEAHGGSVEAANRPKGGAIVTLRFPQ